MLRVRISIRARCTTLCDKVWQWLVTGLVVSSTNKTDLHDITEILLTVALNTIKQTNKQTNNNCVIIRYLLVNNTYRLFLLLQIELIKSHLPYIIIQYIPVFWQKLQNAHNIYPACRISYIFKDEILLALIDWKSTSITGTQWNQNPINE